MPRLGVDDKTKRTDRVRTLSCYKVYKLRIVIIFENSAVRVRWYIPFFNIDIIFKRLGNIRAHGMQINNYIVHSGVFLFV